MKSVQVSVIIPMYNCEKYIGRCIRSLLKQTLSDSEYEIILIDDCSTDNSGSVIRPFTGDIRYFKNDKQLGLPATLNRGIREAKGQFIVRVDSDDYVHWEYLKILSMHLQLNNNMHAIACDYLLVDDNQNTLSHENCLKKPIGCGVMFRLDNLIEIGLYNEEFLAREDEELSKRFKMKYDIYRVSLPLYRYRRHENNLTNNKKNMDTFAKKLNNNNEK
tara:strand:+ start:73 stop:726 length:654 start_codon:yes stop_codon:yes gene_type:complete